MIRRSAKLSTVLRTGQAALHGVTADLAMPPLSPDEVTEQIILRKGNSKTTKDFFAWAATAKNVQFHAPVHIKLRANGLRSVFLNEGSFVRRNTPLFTIPLSSAVTTANIYSQLPKLDYPPVSAELVRPLFTDSEMVHITDQVLLAAAISMVTYRYSKIDDPWADDSPINPRAGLLPYCRMIDDENFDDKVLLQMYRNGLDTFQFESYNEIMSMFSHSVTNIHSKLALPVPLEHFRRTLRVVIARVEHLPTKKEAMRPPWQKRMLRPLRRLAKIRSPVNCCLVPMMDMLNHSNRPNAAARIGASPLFDGHPAVAMMALTDISGGQEICRHYNMAMERAACFFRYGFLPYDIMTVEEFDGHDEYLVKGGYYDPHRMLSKPPDVVANEKRVEDEVERLQDVWKSTRRPKTE